MGRHDADALAQFLGGRDMRQLFARDRRDPDGELVFLPHGEADRFRELCNAGHLICPVPGCAHPRYTPVGGTSGRRHHFKHRAAGAGRHSPERYFHLVGKDVLAAWARRLHPDADVRLEVHVDSGQIADVLVTLATGELFALEIQYSAIDYASWHARDRNYRLVGITPVWLFGHIPPHLVRARGDHREGEVRVSALARQMLDVRRGPVHLLNPDTQQVARLLPQDDVDALRAAGAEVPFVWGDTAALGVMDLADCTLDPQRGLCSPWDDRLAAAHEVLRQRAQAEADAARAAEERAARGREAAERRREADRRAEVARQERQKTLGARLADQATRERGRISNADHPIITGGDGIPELAGLPGNAWRLLLYRNTLHGKRGRDIDSRALYGAAKRLLGDVDPASRAKVVTAWIFALRSHRFLDFVSYGKAIIGPVRVLADLERLPVADIAQPRRRRRVRQTDKGYAVVDHDAGVEFAVTRGGRVVGQRRLEIAGAAGDADAEPQVVFPPPPPPSTDWRDRRREGRPSDIPDWVTVELETDAGVAADAADWHAELWCQFIAGHSGKARHWQQLMALVALYNNGGRKPPAQRALLGFTEWLREHGAVRFTAPTDGYPHYVHVV